MNSAERDATGIALAVTIGVFAIDQAVKAWALALPISGAGMEINHFLRIVPAWNKGLNFGLLNGEHLLWQPYLLAGISILVGLALLAWAMRFGGLWLGIACGAMAGGGWANGFDRLAYGAVHDYLNVSCCGIWNPYIFNVADAAIVLGVLALILRPKRARSAISKAR